MVNTFPKAFLTGSHILKGQTVLLRVPTTQGWVWIITVKYTKRGLESFNGNSWWSSSNALKDSMKRKEGGGKGVEGEAEKSCPGVNTAPQPWSEMNGRPSVRDRRTNNSFPSVLTSPHQAPGPPPLYFISPNPEWGAGEMHTFLWNFAQEREKKKRKTLLPVSLRSAVVGRRAAFSHPVPRIRFPSSH